MAKQTLEETEVFKFMFEQLQKAQAVLQKFQRDEIEHTALSWTIPALKALQAAHKRNCVRSQLALFAQIVDKQLDEAYDEVEQEWRLVWPTSTVCVRDSVLDMIYAAIRRLHRWIKASDRKSAIAAEEPSSA